MLGEKEYDYCLIQASVTQTPKGGEIDKNHWAQFDEPIQIEQVFIISVLIYN